MGHESDILGEDNHTKSTGEAQKLNPTINKQKNKQATNGFLPSAPSPHSLSWDRARALSLYRRHLGRGWPLACLAGAALRRSQRLAVLQRYRRVVLLNLRRHDDATPLVSGAVARRDSIMQPSGAIIHAARRFLASHGLAFGTFDAVQLRSNHVAHELYAVSSAGCPKRLASCLEQLTAVASRSTVIASDIATLVHSHQDGETHRRHAYMRHCLLPAAPMVLRWYRASGIAFNASDLLLGAGGADAGALGMVDLVLASEARALTAVDAPKKPHRLDGGEPYLPGAVWTTYCFVVLE
ncbi:hypothetical protein EMIHUDRAFT_236455 [Emiliania huxleyi CCMP1516]|uniref:Uncharacterized protein n=2 Tax=Emiliania huxleyi TaxID=2903 RepID=A0A0D3JTE9_EMIH1|nr:hypothetical protein EMIHUDRAFT_236455 [Emiliania huxleyi CCMP1516]EOD26784.1 hypothetical protein EMIHUDRAFT_236455 [Emiliania huxleyi CCMP1516]|eukprot:XP_005779213.1 hypothetical protein EMIHUDRAFT_236455 [Emiliania huxleyi CCMP1516]